MAKSKRVKSAKPAIIPIENWEQAAAILREVGDNQLAIRQVEADAKSSIDEIKAELAQDVKPRKELIDQDTRSLEAFAVGHKSEFGKTRSRQMNFGTLGWRKTTSISITKKTTVDLIRQVLSKAKAAVCINVKETVSKDGLAKLTEDQLAELHASRKVKNDFFVEPDLPEAVDY